MISVEEDKKFTNIVKKENPKRVVFEFSKIIIIMETILVCYVTYKTIGFIEMAIITQFTGSLSYLTTLISVVWAAYGTSVSFYYNKSKAENVNKINNSSENNMNRDC